MKSDEIFNKIKGACTSDAQARRLTAYLKDLPEEDQLKRIQQIHERLHLEKSFFDLDTVRIFVSSPAYAYEESEGKFAGEMLETHITHRYLANSYGEAVKMAVAHAKERYDSCINHAYKNCFFSSIKVWIEEVGRIDLNNGAGSTKNLGQFFEWKYDWPGDLEGYVESFLKSDLGLKTLE